MANNDMNVDEVKRTVRSVEHNKANTQEVSKFPEGKKASNKKSGATGKESGFKRAPNSRR